jgi:hypothetical protein
VRDAPIQIAGANGGESKIKLGARIESNLFVRTDGDTETISFKAPGNAGAYAQTTGHGASGSSEPIVYRLNMKQPDSLLSAQRFLVRDKDVVYFANSPSTELSKFLGLLGAGVGVTNSGSATVVRVVN